MDEADISVKNEEFYLEESLRKVRNTEIPKGTKGECQYCGEYFERIVNGACARCRDKYKLK